MEAEEADTSISAKEQIIRIKGKIERIRIGPAERFNLGWSEKKSSQRFKLRWSEKENVQTRLQFTSRSERGKGLTMSYLTA